MWRSRMFWRLFGTFSVFLVCALALLGFIIVTRVEQHYLEQIEDSLRTKAILVNKALPERSTSEPWLQEWTKTLGKDIDTRITLIGEEGSVVADSQEDPRHMDNHAGRKEINEARQSGFGSATRESSTLHQPLMYVAIRTQTSPIAYVRVAWPLDHLTRQSAWLHRVVGGAVAGTGLAALAMALWLTRRIIRPLEEVTAGAERIAAGEYGMKVYAAGRDEMAALARAFNEMSRRLASQFAQLAEDRQQLRMILSGMVEGVVALDAEERVLFANERAAQLLGFQLQTITGRKLWEAVRKRSLQDIVQRALLGGEACSGEINGDGLLAASVTVHAVGLPGSPPRGAVLVLHDTSELRRLERLRQDFVANVSHELKTPLSVIKANVETLLEGAVNDAEHRGPFLERIAEQAERLHALILDLLSLTRIESGTEAFAFESVALAPVVTACLERHRARATSKSQVLEAVPPHGNPSGAAAWADEEAIHQILDNLVDNALKYTPAGGHIWVRWHAVNGYIRLEVEDTGIGIPEHDLPRIFERFYRVDKARSRELGGTGLGLSIIKHLAQAMHGNVHAASRPGEGTIFSVELPCTQEVEYHEPSGTGGVES